MSVVLAGCGDEAPLRGAVGHTLWRARWAAEIAGHAARGSARSPGGRMSLRSRADSLEVSVKVLLSAYMPRHTLPPVPVLSYPAVRAHPNRIVTYSL